jgi:hypothetical protein
MFGESESESPRVPSPWDSFISTSPSPSSFSPATRGSPLSKEIPRLVPEADDGNVEYKLQLLNPSPARFARLVTQLKWRLLEGGGQAYYELGVADSGALVGLRRKELEMTLETLEMMAGEIGASVIVVKEIEVPVGMAEFIEGEEKRKRFATPEIEMERALLTDSTETELSSATEDDEEEFTFKNDGSSTSSLEVFTMDSDAEPIGTGSTTSTTPQDPVYDFIVDLEISSVFKPRPLRTKFSDALRANNGNQKHSTRGPKPKKIKGPFPSDGADGNEGQNAGKQGRRSVRNKRREEKRKHLPEVALAASTRAVVASPASKACGANDDDILLSRQTTLLATARPVSAAETHELVTGLEALHVAVDEPTTFPESGPLAKILTGNETATISPTDPVSPAIPGSSTADETEEDAEADSEDVFPTPSIPNASASFVSARRNAADVNGEEEPKTRLIVEALVVRKMSLEEAFLDFQGFSVI